MTRTADAIVVAEAAWLLERPDSGLYALPGTDTGYDAWYLGDEPEVYRSLRMRLPAARWQNAGPRMSDIALRHNDAFVNLDEGFEICDREWWEHRDIAERGPYSTTFVADCCRLILFNDITAAPGHYLFITDGDDLADELARAANARGRRVRRLGAGVVRRLARRWLGAGMEAVRFLRAALRWYVRIRRLRAMRRRHPVPAGRLAGCQVLLAAWTKEGDFPPGQHRDLAHSMGMLPRWLRERGVTVGYIALALDEIGDADTIHREVVRSPEAVMLAEDALTPGMVLRAALSALRPRARPKASFAIGGHDVCGIARMVMRRERFRWRPANNALWAAVGDYLARLGCRPTTLFHVYENQTWEKALRQGMRRALPRVRIVGCHQSPFSALYPNLLPARAELESGHWPDVVLTHGARGRRQFLEAGVPGARVAVGGLFRQGAFLVRPNGAPPSADRHRRLLCATGPGYQESCELAGKSAAAVAGRGGLELIINFHPLTGPDFRNGVRAFVARTAAGTGNVRFTDRAMPLLLEEGVGAVLYGDTNAGFDAVSAGARVINVARDHALAFDKLPDGLARRTRTSGDIAAALDDLGDASRWPSADTVSARLADCFASVDMGAILSAAGLDHPAAGQSLSGNDRAMQ